MDKQDVSNDLNLGNSIELLETRKRQLLERRNLCKDPSELKNIEKQLKQIDALLKKNQSTKEKLLKIKAG